MTAPTPLQVWTRTIFDALDDARDNLTDREYTVFVDLALRRVIRESVRTGLDKWREAA